MLAEVFLIYDYQNRDVNDAAVCFKFLKLKRKTQL